MALTYLVVGKILRRTITLLLLSAATHAAAALPRYPQAYAGRIVFSANENLWTVSQNGGVAQQLTRGAGNHVYPRVSPDGQWIAYTDIGGEGSDVWVLPAAGGDPRRLTWHDGRGLDNIVVTWSPDSKNIVYLSQHEQWNPAVRKLYRVPVAGGPPEPLPLDSAVGMASYAPDGHTIAYNRVFAQYGNWKRYDGGMARQIFSYDLKTREMRPLSNWSGTNAFPMWYGRRIYYLSDQEAGRHANIWVHELDSGKRRQVTHFTDYDVDTPALGDNAIAFQQGGKLFHLHLPDERLVEVPFTIPGENPRVAKRSVPASTLVRDAEIVQNSDQPDRVNYVLAPDGLHGLFSARGELFSVATSDGAAQNLTGSPGVEEGYPAWSPDGSLVVYVTDVTGNQQLAIRPAAGGAERILTQFSRGYLFRPVFAADGRHLSFSDGEHRLWTLDLRGGGVREVAQDKRQGIHDQAYSPDGRWLAFSMAATGRRRELYLYETASGRLQRLGRGEGSDANPAWSPDGKRLYFTSARYVNPVPSDQENDFAMLKSTGINVIVLPDDLARIDPSTLMDQAVAVPVAPGNIVQLDARGEKLYYLTRPIALFNGVLQGEQSALQVFDVAAGTGRVAAEDVDSYSLSANGATALLKQGPGYALLDTRAVAGNQGVRRQLSLDGLHVEVDPPAEWAQMLDNAWRLERDLFISPAMNGQDWEAVHARYRKLVPLLGSRSDLNWLLGEMLGELGNSHVYVGGGDDGRAGRASSPPRLGADWTLDPASGRYRLAKIYGGDNTLPDYRSPLRQPGLAVAAGDYVLAIDGRELKAPATPGMLLHGLDAAKPLTLTVAATSAGTRRDVRVTPVASELNLRELDWIDENRRKVDRLSGGRVGYVYLSNMGQRGLEQFTRQFYAQLNKQALVIDDRWNGGGSVAEYVLERLRRRQVAFTGNRTGAMDSQPEQVAAAPKVVLINHWSASNGELFPFLFQQYGLGKVVGTRSWGGLRGYNGDTPLMDGGYITIPVRAVYDMRGKPGVENHGVDPDIEVDNTPAEVLAGRDHQLETGVDLMLRAIAVRTGSR
jgi:tricorn protease